MNICDSCNNHFNIMYKKFYNNQFNNLCIIFKDSKINNFDILNEIFSYLSYKNHKVTHQLKKRIIPENDEDSDDEVYWHETKNLCTFCFQSGIIESLEIQKRLPFLRRDIYYFLNEKRDIDYCKKKWKDKYNEFYLRYMLPQNYNNLFYRQETPLQISDNKFVIL